MIRTRRRPRIGRAGIGRVSRAGGTGDDFLIGTVSHITRDVCMRALDDENETIGVKRGALETIGLLGRIATRSDTSTTLDRMSTRQRCVQR